MRRWTQSVVRRKITVHTDAATFEGILKEEHRDGVVLVNTILVREEGGPLEMAGDTFIPRECITVIQVLS